MNWKQSFDRVVSASTCVYSLLFKFLSDLDKTPYEVNNIEHRLHRWSVESMLASLLGELYFDIIGSHFDMDQLIKNVQNMFSASTRSNIEPCKKM